MDETKDLDSGEVVAMDSDNDAFNGSPAGSSETTPPPMESEEQKICPGYTPPHRPSVPAEEGKIMETIAAENKDLVAGAKWYIIAISWYSKWESFVKGDSISTYDTIGSFGTTVTSTAAPQPGPVDNTSIVVSNTNLLRDYMSENSDYTIITEKEWVTLIHWYGGGPAVTRTVQGIGKKLFIDMKPLTLYVCKSTDTNKKVTVETSKAEKVSTWKARVAPLFGLDPNKVLVVDYYKGHRSGQGDLMSDQVFNDCNILDGQDILLDELDNEGRPIVKPASSSSYSYGSSYSQPVTPGTTGLSNLGNTCFMNSSLQCLAHTRTLIDFFVTDEYKNQINDDNPLGTGGGLVNSFGSLIKELRSGRSSYISPRDFKRNLEQFAPQFAGYQQHDSQELLAFLLDGIHEDVNRIRKKPYIENPEVGDRKKEEVAAEAWQAHRSRNDSIIVDNFQGQLMSTLVCPKCDRVSITFDPFMYLSLPIPVTTIKMTYVTLYYNDNKPPVKLACQVPKNGTVGNLRTMVSKLTGIHPTCVAFCEVDNNKRQIEKLVSNDATSLDDYSRGYYRSNVLVAYEVEVGPEISHFAISWKDDNMGDPFVLSVKNGQDITYKGLYDLVYNKIKRLLKLPEDRIYRTVEEYKGVDSSSETEDREVPVVRKRNEDSSSDDETNDIVSAIEDDGDLPSRSKKKIRNSTAIFTLATPPSSLWSTQYSSRNELVDNDKPLNLEDHSALIIKMSRDIYKDIVQEAEKPEYHSSYDAATQDFKDKSDRPITLGNCIELFTEKEELGPDDPWFCSKCKEFRQATKKFDLWSLPPVLVVHMKRFLHRGKWTREKLDSVVDFPLESLDLGQYVMGPNNTNMIYDLYAVSNHYGGLGGGHYTAYAKNTDDKWYKFDDSHVSPQTERHIVDSSAYVLFYQRRGVSFLHR